MPQTEREPLTEAEIELGHELVRYARILHLLKAEMGRLVPAGLDPAAAGLLAWLVRQGASRQSDLAGSTFLDPSTVSRRIAQLVAHGLVERAADPGDGRAVLLAPTALGTEVFDRVRERREQIVHQVLTGWDASDVAEFRRLMCKFNDGFESFRTF
jgi:DNA-binding MarR family transcriptional regulator